MKPEIVVLVGFGDCAKKHYWHVLMTWAARGRIQLFVIDKFLNRPVELENIPNVTYLQVEKDAEFIRTLQVDAVYIVVTDDLHCEIAAQWLGRASVIYIEKPIDRSYKAAVRLLMRLSNLRPNFYPFYLSQFLR
jgi:predicted dehydrogenase